jgi:hypothetical protein
MDSERDFENGISEHLGYAQLRQSSHLWLEKERKVYVWEEHIYVCGRQWCE